MVTHSRSGIARVGALARQQAPTLVIPLMVACSTGIRRKELVLLKKQDFDPVRGTITVGSEKQSRFEEPAVIGSLKAAISWAVDEGLLKSNPIKRWPKIKVKRQKPFMWKSEIEAIIESHNFENDAERAEFLVGMKMRMVLTQEDIKQLIALARQKAPTLVIPLMVACSDSTSGAIPSAKDRRMPCCCRFLRTTGRRGSERRPPGPKIIILDLNHPFEGDVDCANGPCACNDDQSSDGWPSLRWKVNGVPQKLGLRTSPIATPRRSVPPTADFRSELSPQSSVLSP